MMPLQPPGNTEFYAYRDANGKIQTRHIGAEPITCASCERSTYPTASGRCPWCAKPQRVEGRG
jgi:hypothetical protein